MQLNFTQCHLMSHNVTERNLMSTAVTLSKMLIDRVIPGWMWVVVMSLARIVIEFALL